MVRYCITLNYIVLYYTIPYHTVLYYTYLTYYWYIFDTCNDVFLLWITVLKQTFVENNAP